MKHITCIIPAYNEGPRIRGVLSVVAGHPLVNEVVVVNDCSKDNTAEIVAEFPSVRLVNHTINQGKSLAIVTGLKEARNDTVMFIDADLIGITPQNITDLIAPVADGAADISISLRKNAPPAWHWIGLDYISGERVMPKEFILSHASEIAKLPRFGLETWMNKLIVSKKYRIRVVRWDNVESPFKYNKAGKKFSAFTAIKDEWPMMQDIFKVANPIRLLALIYQMLSLRV